MLKPSYADLMNVLNENSDNAVTSRYTVVIASAKRARQIIDGDEPMIDTPVEGKPLSTAVEEIYEGKVKVVPEGEGTVLNIHKHIESDIRAELEQATEEPSDENDIAEDIDGEDSELDFYAAELDVEESSETETE